MPVGIFFIPKYFSSIQIFLQGLGHFWKKGPNFISSKFFLLGTGHLWKKEPEVIFLYSKIFFKYSYIFAGERALQGVKVEMLGRQNERNSSYVRLAQTSIFGLCFMTVCLMKSNCYSLIYSSLGPCNVF